MVNCCNQLAEVLHRLLSQSNTKSRCLREVNVWKPVPPRFPPMAPACSRSLATGTSLLCCMLWSSLDLLSLKSDGDGAVCTDARRRATPPAVCRHGCLPDTPHSLPPCKHMRR